VFEGEICGEEWREREEVYILHWMKSESSKYGKVKYT
jgi:hypothetical protein